MAGLPDEQRVLAEIEQHLVQEDPRLAARMESYSARLEGHAGRRGARRSRKSMVIITISWLLIATFVATLLLLALLHPAAALRL